MGSTNKKLSRDSFAVSRVPLPLGHTTLSNPAAPCTRVTRYAFPIKLPVLSINRFVINRIVKSRCLHFEVVNQPRRAERRGAENHQVGVVR